jgi:hypothetical protein
VQNLFLVPADKLQDGYILGKCIKDLADVKIGQFVKVHYLLFSEEYFQPYDILVTSDEEIISLSEINSLPLSDGKDIQTNMSNI